MPAEVPGANRSVELQWAEDHEEKSRNNVNQCENGVAGKHLIERYELCGSRVGCNRWRRISVYHNRKKHRGPAGSDGNPKHSKKDDCAPDKASETNSWLHARYYAETA